MKQTMGFVKRGFRLRYMVGDRFVFCCCTFRCYTTCCTPRPRRRTTDNVLPKGGFNAGSEHWSLQTSKAPRPRTRSSRSTATRPATWR